MALSGRGSMHGTQRGGRLLLCRSAAFISGGLVVAPQIQTTEPIATKSSKKKKTYDASEEVFALNWNTIAPAHRQKLRR